MGRAWWTGIVLSLSILALSFPAQAQQAGERYAVGFHLGLKSFGFAARLGGGGAWALEGVLGLWGNSENYALRGLRTLRRAPHWRTYAVGVAAMWRDAYSAFLIDSIEYAVGVGLEYDWLARRGDDAPPVAWLLEMGMGFDSDRFGMTVGVGLRYKF